VNQRDPGIHHVTAIATDPQTNYDFYAGVLGLRFVKKTVNFDDPGTYHFYFGDAAGRPGTIMTFFPWPLSRPGRRGTGQVTVTSFSVPADSLGFWTQHLEARDVQAKLVGPRLGEEVLSFRDPDGLELELVAHDEVPGAPPSTGGPVPPDAAIRGFHGVTLMLEGYQATASLLTGAMGFQLAGEEGNRYRFAAGGSGPGQVVDLLCAPDSAPGIGAAGTVHHVAFRAGSTADQLSWREELVDGGMNVTPVLDRNYFRSIYFREPGGVLFEIATDPPGFTADESLEELGTSLKLPSRLEPHRARIELALPELKTGP
jgi:glyoxalase family protein